MTTPTLRVEGSKQVEELQRRYQQAVGEMGNLSVPHGRIAVKLDQWVQRNFKTQGGLVGGWKPFKYGGRVGYGDPPPGASPFNIRVPWGVLDGWIDKSAKLLQDTGALRLSFRPFADKKDAGIGSDLPYSKYHNEGKGVPKRRMLPILREVLPMVRKAFTGHIKEIAHKHELGEWKGE